MTDNTPLAALLHPQHSDRVFLLDRSGRLLLYRNDMPPLRDYGTIPSMLVHRPARFEVKDGKPIPLPLEDVPYTGKYIAELLWPYMAIFQKYGTNGCVCHLETGELRLFSRGDYHAEVSCFSMGLLEREGHVCLLHATEWNRLDITDLDTGELLTEREVSFKSPAEQKNYRDYFHGRISLSPDGRYFVDTGWVWQPAGVPKLWRTEDFLSAYECADITLCIGDSAFYGEYWDTPAVWLDEHTFALPLQLCDDFVDELAEEEGGEGLLASLGGRSTAYLRFDVRDTVTEGGQRRLSAAAAEPLPLYAEQVYSYPLPWSEKPSPVRCTSCCPNLCYDRQQQLLLSTEGSMVSVCDGRDGRRYCFRFSMPLPWQERHIELQYDTRHHLLYSCCLRGEQASLSAARLRDLLPYVESC